VIRVVALIGSALGGALLLAAVLLIARGGGSDDTAKLAPKPATYTSTRGDFSIATPKGWKAVADGSAATVLRRTDDRGLVVIHRRAALRGALDVLAPRLERALAKQLPGLRPAGTRRVALGGTQGLISTFVRPAAGQVQSVVVAPAGDRAYTLDLVADGDAPDVARELAGIVRSFSPRS
jgi:hypothetical protein